MFKNFGFLKTFLIEQLFSNLSLGKRYPTWLYPEDLQFEAKEYFSCMDINRTTIQRLINGNFCTFSSMNINRTTIWRLWMEISADFLHSTCLHSGSPLRQNCFGPSDWNSLVVLFHCSLGYLKTKLCLKGHLNVYQYVCGKEGFSLRQVQQQCCGLWFVSVIVIIISPN